MTAYSARYTLAQDATFQGRCAVAATITAEQYTSETAETVELDRKRRALAVTVLGNPAGLGARFALAVAAQDVLAADTDDTIQTMVYQQWDGMAGVNADDYA